MHLDPWRLVASNQRPHQNSTLLEVVVKNSDKRSNLIHHASSVINRLVTLPKKTASHRA